MTAADEGVFQVSIHSDSGTICVPVPYVKGRGIAIDLAEIFSDWLEKVERNLNYSLENLGEELKSDRKEAEQKQETKEAQQREQRQRNLVQIAQANEATALALQAATPAPSQPGPGRPKKAKPQPALVGELATGAAAVPMNHGSTGHAAARATNLPQA